jgi:hypothetical protein
MGYRKFPSSGTLLVAMVIPSVVVSLCLLPCCRHLKSKGRNKFVCFPLPKRVWRSYCLHCLTNSRLFWDGELVQWNSALSCPDQVVGAESYTFMSSRHKLTTILFYIAFWCRGGINYKFGSQTLTTTLFLAVVSLHSFQRTLVSANSFQYQYITFSFTVQ